MSQFTQPIRTVNISLWIEIDFLMMDASANNNNKSIFHEIILFCSIEYDFLKYLKHSAQGTQNENNLHRNDSCVIGNTFSTFDCHVSKLEKTKKTKN